LAGGLPFSSYIIVEAVKAFGFGTVKVKPPITDKVSLVENGSVGAQERVFGQTTLAIGGTYMESLAFSINITIIS